MFRNYTMKRLNVLLLCLVYIFSKTAECTLEMNKLPLVRVKLSQPPMNRIVEALLSGLSENFKTVSVEVVQCPDLTQPPFNLAAEGLSGNETVIDAGSPSYLLPLVDRSKVYDIKDFKQVTESDPLFVIGAGAGPWPYVGVHSQLITNVRFTGNNYVDNKSHLFIVNPETESIEHVTPKNETRFSVLSNFFTSNGLGGEVLRVECETRTGHLDFVTAIRKALTKYFGDEIVCFGGVILIENGKVKVHNVVDFSKTPINTKTDMQNWLKFYEISAPLIGLGTLVSHDPGLDLEPQHFHLFSGNTSGGHYRHDTEPATIKYTGYFNVAKNLIKIDQTKAPVTLHF